MRKFLILTLAWMGTASLGAQEGTPVPVPPDLDSAAPITDLGPVELPSLPDLDGAAPPSNVPAPSLPAQAPAPAPPTPTVMPAAPAPMPTRIPTLAPTPVPTPIPAAPQVPTAGPSSEAAAPIPASPSTGGLEDYFPWTQGASLKYEYLKPRPGSTMKGTRLVECVARELMPNGTVHFTLRTTEGGRTVEDRYSLYDNKVQHTFAGRQALTDHVILKWPVDGQPVEWKLPGGDGLTHAFKAFPGRERVYQKVYPDCLIVVDKPQGGNSSRFEYYAKGIGLVAVETYGPGMKLIEDESLALVQPEP